MYIIFLYRMMDKTWGSPAVPNGPTKNHVGSIYRIGPYPSVEEKMKKQIEADLSKYGAYPRSQ